MPTVGESASTSPPGGCCRLAGRVAAVGLPAGSAVVANVVAERGPAFSEAAVDGGVAAVGDAHDLVVAVAESFQVERFTLAQLERLHGLQAVVGLESAECPLVGAAAVRVAWFRDLA